MFAFTRQADGFRGGFAVIQNSGILRTGLVAGDFTVTVVDPADTTTSSPAVAQAANKAGAYTFLVPSAFLVANGNGNYLVVVEIDTSGASGAPHVVTAFSTVLLVSEDDIRDLRSLRDNVTGAIIVDRSIDAGGWVERHFEYSTATPLGSEVARYEIQDAASARITDTHNPESTPAIPIDRRVPITFP